MACIGGGCGLGLAAVAVYLFAAWNPLGVLPAAPIAVDVRSLIWFRHGSRLPDLGGDTRTGGVGRSTARRTVLTSSCRRRAISFFGTPSTSCRSQRSPHLPI